MRELIAEILSWLGYLERGSVQLQLLLLAAVLLSLQLRWTRHWLLKWPRAVSPLLGSVVALLLSVGLQARGSPAGLLQFLGFSWLGWTLAKAEALRAQAAESKLSSDLSGRG